MASSWRWWWPALTYMAFIFWMSSRARPPAFDDAPDVVLHGGAYFVLCLLLVRALSRGLRHKATPRVLAGGVILAFLYGISDEWHQGFTATRVASFADMVADGAGALLAAFTLCLFWWSRSLSSAYSDHPIDSSQK